MSTESDRFWDFYWETRLPELDDLGKREAILAASRLIRGLAESGGPPLRLLELGCGEAQVIGALLHAHAQLCSAGASCGVDYSRPKIEKCRRAYPAVRFIEGDFTRRGFLAGLGQFELVLLVNVLHEVFSAGYSPALAQVAVPASKQRVQQTLAGAVGCLAPGGYLVLFDGLEPPGDTQVPLRIRFRDGPARRRFDAFAQEYLPFRVSYRELGDPTLVELSLRDFTRYITKMIFLEKRLWQTERLESYQYFDEAEFRAALARLGLAILELRTLTVNYEKWSSEVEIETPGIDFPAEHILILARKPGGAGRP